MTALKQLAFSLAFAIAAVAVVGLRAGRRVFDGDFYNECSATDVLLGLGDLCSQVIRVERRHLDVHAFCHSRSPLMSGASGGCVLPNAREPAH